MCVILWGTGFFSTFVFTLIIEKREGNQMEMLIENPAMSKMATKDKQRFKRTQLAHLKYDMDEICAICEKFKQFKIILPVLSKYL